MCILNLFHSKLWCLKLKIYYTIKQYYFQNEWPVVESVHKKEVTIHFTREDTFHRGHPLHSVISNYICGSFYLKRNGIDAIYKSRSLELISGTWNYRIGLDYYNLSREVHFWTLVYTNNGHDGHAKNMIVDILFWRRMIFSTMLQCDSIQQGLQQLSLIRKANMMKETRAKRGQR